MREHLKDYIENSKTPSVRGLRILLEYFYATEIFGPIVESKVKIVSVFGSARTKPGTKPYKDAVNLGRELYNNGYAVVTGASRGIMQAANEGLAEGIIDELSKNKKYKDKKEIVASKEYINKLTKNSVGLKISLPFEPDNNPFVGVFGTFHYFMVRKFFFGSLSSAFIACEGGWGTRDELYEILTLVQTGKQPLLPVIYITHQPKHLTDDLKYTVDEGYISEEDMWLIDVVSDYKKAVKIINRFYAFIDKIEYTKTGQIFFHLKNKITTKQQKTVDDLVHKKFKHVFDGVVFKNKRIELVGYNYKSYGYVRKIIDSLSD